jgi:hypothetical protein
MRSKSTAGVVVLALLAACSAQQPQKSKMIWQKVDGGTPTRQELEAAADACQIRTNKSGGSGTGRFGHIEWASHMLECMKEQGYERVEVPADPPATPGDE